MVPENMEPERLAKIEKDLSRSIHVGVRIGAPSDWQSWLEDAGFAVEETRLLPMRLLELDRLVQDEGWLGTSRFLWNTMRTPGAVARLKSVRRTFHEHASSLRAIAIVAVRRRSARRLAGGSRPDGA